MATFLVINFNRYDTEDSTHNYVRANSHIEAIVRNADEMNDPDFVAYVKENLVTKGGFASISEEESDILSYKLISVN